MVQKYYFTNKSNKNAVNFTGYNTVKSRNSSVLPSLLVKDLFKAENADDMISGMVRRVEDSKEERNTLLALPEEDYAMF